MYTHIDSIIHTSNPHWTGPPKDSATKDSAESDARERAEIRRLLREAAEWRKRAALLACRPSVILRPALDSAIDSATGQTFFFASYGCVFAQGATPNEAYHAFDRAWVNGDND